MGKLFKSASGGSSKKKVGDSSRSKKDAPTPPKSVNTGATDKNAKAKSAKRATEKEKAPTSKSAKGKAAASSKSKTSANSKSTSTSKKDSSKKPPAKQSKDAPKKVSPKQGKTAEASRISEPSKRTYAETREYLAQLEEAREQAKPLAIIKREPVRKADDSPESQLLSNLNFCHPLRKYQLEILDLIKRKLEDGERELHIVAPPGAGKTIIGLQIVSELCMPSLIVCPNTTIQSQWKEKLVNFLPPELIGFGVNDFIGTHDDLPLKPITVMTYQVLSTPGREQEYIDRLAHASWVEELTSGRGITIGDAELRILELLQNNKKAHQKELSRHSSRLRKQLSEVLDLNEVLHENALGLLQALKRQKFRLIIFDECHHLTDYWAAIMKQLLRRLDDPVVVGLTGTPPEGKTATQETRYISLVGEIDYQVPTPALVREGGLAPFQDLVYFTSPTEKELEFLEAQHVEFHNLICELTDLSHVPQSPAKATAKQPKSAVPPELPAELAVPESTLVDDFEDSDFSYGAIEWDPDGLPIGHVTTVPPTPPESVATSPPLQSESFPSADTLLPPEPVPPSIPSSPYALSASSVEFYTSQEGRWTHARTNPTSPYAIDPQKDTKFTAWIKSRVLETEATGFHSIMQSHPEFATALYRSLWRLKLPLPKDVDQSDYLRQSPFLDDWMLLLEDFASRHLKLSADKDDHELYDKIRSAARKLGYGITEQGLRKQASPVDRVLAFSESKPQAVAEILTVEYRSMQDRLRSVIVTDFERMSATSVKGLKGIIDEESGGAVAALKVLLAHEISQFVNPVLVTGSLLLVDCRIAEQFLSAAQEWLSAQGHTFKLHLKGDESLAFREITATSGAWESRLYVGLATAIFERGITKCLIGTRGLFGEGWDSQALNTLIDLTMTTSPVSVKQLRGRSIRIQTNDPLSARKVANNWDVVCVAPELEKGLNDYGRFARKHQGYFGICDDGQIECGVGHVHPTFSELTPSEVFASAEEFNKEMIERALVRDQIYDLWKVGQPYNNCTLGCVEVTGLRSMELTPPSIRQDLPYVDHAKQMRHSMIAVWAEHTALGAAGAGILTFFLSSGGLPLIAAILPIILALALARTRVRLLFNRLKKEVCQPNTQESSINDIAIAVLTALQRTKFVPPHIDRDSIKISLRSDGSYRVFLDDVDPNVSKNFINSFREVMAPITNQPLLIPKYEYVLPTADSPPSAQDDVSPVDSDQLPVVVPDTEETLSEDKFFKLYLAGKAKPRVAAYHAVPALLARSEKGRDAFEEAWNKYVSPGYIISTESKPELLNKYYGIGPSLAQRLLWE